MGFLQTLEADLKKIFAYLPLVSSIAAISDPTAAPEIMAATTAVTQLQPAIAAIQAAQAAAGNPALTQAQLTQKVTDAITVSSTELNKLGVMSSTTDAHIQALAPAINAAVALSNAPAA